MSKQSKGYCKYCGKEYTRGGMLRHLSSCPKRADRLKSEAAKSVCGYFQIVITGKYDSDYWLIVEVNENSTLKELDQFLRDIWLECCGHLSAFEIRGVRYEISPDNDWGWGTPAKSMNYKLRNILSIGEKFSYEYDFGSTTDLILNIHSYRTGGKHPKEKIVILSRNNPPEIFCNQCGVNKAQWINPFEIYKGNPFWCDECLEKTGNEEMECLLPVCNSQRMGVCGYEGSVYYPDQFEPDKSDDIVKRTVNEKES